MNIFHPRAASRPHIAPDALRLARNPPAAAEHAALALIGALAFALGLGGCGGGAGSPTYGIGGSVAGLTTAGLVLANGADTASLAAGATSFTFSTALATGSSYAICRCRRNLRMQPVS